ncbi:hypothetical protein C1925_01560 [Stenotrophomonas sp. SAU14A_NAIMI4_5]|uniref:SGNH/GDSL hydrolase family protein n=1 Tax=Stenotrophomonas sp. SAU14A_NAIMI4_5 TaxID=2072413 RepID=UPI000D53F374|nr:SGNH/GDSL hydrolase family protein [Stenotrophomonas sp. SAU14A_NAIMI4_5]AWH47944.1 hypothetical protein C1925_01560 [Stenotrophomonas sp. SAU14A_NAIMI4_5]
MSVNNKVDQFIADTDTLHQVVHGPAGVEVPTDGGPLPTLAGIIGEATTLPRRVDVLESAQSSGRLVLSTWAQLLAIPTTGGNRGASIISDGGNHVDPVSGVSVPNNGDYTEQAQGWHWERAESLASKASVTSVDALASTQSALSSALGAVHSYTRSHAVAATDVYSISSFRGWQVGFDVSDGGGFPEETALDGVGVPGVRVALPVAFVRVGVHLRTKEGGNLASPAPAAGDKTVYTVVHRVTSLGLVPGASQSVDLFVVIPTVKAEELAGKVVFVTVEALNDKGQLADGCFMGVGRTNAVDASVPGYQRGQYITTGLWTQINGTRVAISAYSGITEIPQLEKIPLIEQAASNASLAADLAAQTTGKMLASGEFLPAFMQVGGVDATATYGTSSFTGWMVGAAAGSDLSVGHQAQRFRQYARLGGTVERLDLVVYERISTGSQSAAPVAGDVTVLSQSFTPAQVGLVPGQAAEAEATFPCDFMVREGRTYLFEVTAWDGAGVRSFIGVGRQSAVDSDVPQIKRGWWRTTGLWNGMTGFRAAFAVDTEVLQSKSAAEVRAARGRRSSLGDRLDRCIDQYGNPVRCFNSSSLRQYRYRRTRLTAAKRSGVAESIQNRYGVISTSWGQNGLRGQQAVAEHLFDTQGFAAAGLVSLGFAAGGGTFVKGGYQPSSINGHVQRERFKPVWHGAWSSPDYGYHSTPDFAICESSAPGAFVELAIPESTTVVRLYWEATADGVCEYTYDGVNWNTLPVQGAAVGSCYWSDLAAAPAAGATLRVRVVSGRCALSSFFLDTGRPGAMFIKLAVGGGGISRVKDQVNKGRWKEAIASLGINTMMIMHGTNDQGSVAGPAFGTNLEIVADAVLSALPACDIGFIVEPENARANVFAMKDMARLAAKVAGERDWAFLDLQHAFGSADDPLHYQAIENGGTFPAINKEDLFHPSLDVGAPLIAGETIQLLDFTI